MDFWEYMPNFASFMYEQYGLDRAGKGSDSGIRV